MGFKAILGFALTLLLSAICSVPALAASSLNQLDLTNLNGGQPNGVNARDHGFKFGGGKCVFDPSATAASRTVGAHTCDLAIPANAYVTKAYYKVITTFTSAADSATIAISVASANDITTATAISAGGDIWDAGGVVIGTPTGSMANEIAITAVSYPTFTVAVQALTAGKLVLWVEWVYYGDI